MFRDLKEKIYVMKERQCQYRNINYKNEPSGNSRADLSNRAIFFSDGNVLYVHSPTL